MAIITISRGSYSHGKEIAEKVAEMLGYECVSREILLEASQYFKISEKKLLESIHDAPSMLDRVTRGREKYIAYIRAALLDHVQKDKVVYHGHAGHLLIPEIRHVLKVRVIADMDERIAFVREQRKLSWSEAVTFLENEDKQRALWTRYLYKVDVEDPRMYDILLHIGGLRISDACDIICTAAKSEAFTTTQESQKTITDLAIVSHVKAALQDICDAEVKSIEGMVYVDVPAQRIRRTGVASPRLQRHVRETIQDDLTKEIMQVLQHVPGVKKIFCNVERPYYS